MAGPTARNNSEQTFNLNAAAKMDPALLYALFSREFLNILRAYVDAKNVRSMAVPSDVAAVMTAESFGKANPFREQIEGWIQLLEHMRDLNELLQRQEALVGEDEVELWCRAVLRERAWIMLQHRSVTEEGKTARLVRLQLLFPSFLTSRTTPSLSGLSRIWSGQYATLLQSGYTRSQID
jgi:hypothetical protein